MQKVYTNPELALKRARGETDQHQAELMAPKVEALVAERMATIVKLFEVRVKETKVRSRSLELQRAAKRRTEMYQLLFELTVVQKARDEALRQLRETEAYVNLSHRLEAAQQMFKVQRTDRGTIPGIFPDGELAHAIDGLKACIKDLESVVEDVFGPEISGLEAACADAKALVAAEQAEWSHRTPVTAKN